MSITLNLESQEVFEENDGDKMSLSSFINTCQAGGFIDYDGYACEILLNGHIVSNEILYPSKALAQKEHLLSLEETYGALQVVWYNR